MRRQIAILLPPPPFIFSQGRARLVREPAAFFSPPPRLTLGRIGSPVQASRRAPASADSGAFILSDSRPPRLAPAATFKGGPR